MEKRSLILPGSCLILLVSLGCRGQIHNTYQNMPSALQTQTHITEIEYPDMELAMKSLDTLPTTLPPRRIADAGAGVLYRDISLNETIQIALSNSRVLKDLNGRLLRTPDGLATVFDPAIQQSNPTFGVEGALSEFDTQASTGLFWTGNDRAINNISLGGGTRNLQQDLAESRTELRKQTASGAQFSFRNITLYDASNAPGNLFESGWEQFLEVETRVPLLRGAGLEFNRIAGPNAVPGVTFNGVMLARIDEDISLADFEAGVRNYISSIEDAYWELQFAYHDLASKRFARDQSLKMWQTVKARCEQAMNGGETGKEAQSREQYFFYQDAVNESLGGAGSGGLTVGVYSGERQLRRLLGLQPNDGELLRPIDQPLAAPVVFAWEETLSEALVRRVEVRRQMWQIERAELELSAARNLAKPQLDLIALYRMRGFGDEFGGSAASTALDDLTSGDHQEFHVGVEYRTQVGRRRALAGVRHAQLKLCRARAILKEQHLEITHDLSDAIARTERTFIGIETNLNRMIAAKEHVDARLVEYEAGRSTLDIVLRAQMQLSDAQSRYHRAQTDYMLALKETQLQMGTLLQNHQVNLCEGLGNQESFESARENAERWRPRPIGLLHRGQHTL